MLPRLYHWLKKSKWRAILFGIGVLFVLWLFFIGSVSLMHYSETSEFCSLCHIMAPEHTAYKGSAHEKVACGTCHIGPGALAAFEAKVPQPPLRVGLSAGDVRAAHPVADHQPAPRRGRLRAVPLAAEVLRRSRS